MVSQNFLDQLLRWLLSMFGDLLEGLVGWGKDGVVSSSAIQDLNQIWVFVDEFGELSGVLGASNELVDSQVWLLVRAVTVMWMLGVSGLARSLVRMIEHVVKVEIFDCINGRVKPALGIEGHHRVVAFESACSFLAGIGGSVDGIVEGILAERNGILKALLGPGPNVLDGSFEVIEIGLRLFLDGNLFHHLVIREDKGSGERGQRQNGSEELHSEDC